ncbi:MAG: cupin domain-containing protein [Corallococcus sp.]|nr:cupin domain-containing protein [Corallococcus sp.]
MLIDFNKMQGHTMPCMNNGTGEMSAKMYSDNDKRIIYCCIHKGGSIGLHTQDNGDDINYVLSGTGKAVCDGTEELLSSGVCHICKEGSAHTIINTGEDDLVLLTIVK